MIKEVKSLKESLENTSKKQDESYWTSCFEFFLFMGCSPSWAKIRANFFSLFYDNSLHYAPIKKCKTLVY